MADIGKIFLFFGIILLVVGAILIGLAKLGFRGMPGDVRYQSNHVQIYFPIVSCIVISVALTLLMWLWRWWAGK